MPVAHLKKHTGRPINYNNSFLVKLQVWSGFQLGLENQHASLKQIDLILII